MAENRIDTIPNFVRAESLAGLRSAMLKNNMRLGAFVLYRDIQQVEERGRKFYIAWYDEPATKTFNTGVANESTS
jgi:hypothetical protein